MLPFEFKVVLYIIAGIAGFCTTYLSGKVGTNILYKFWKRGRKPSTKPPTMWAAFITCAVISLVSGSVAALSPSPPDGNVEPLPSTGLIKISPDNNPLPAFKWSSVAGATSYEVKVDFGPWINNGRSLSFVQPQVLTKGNHTFAVQAKDATGNVGATASLSFNVAVDPDLKNTRIAYAVYSTDIYTMNPDGSRKIRLTTHPAEDNYPFWSPDGSKITFTSKRDGKDGVFVMAADGSDQTNLSQSGPHSSGAPWSPDGGKIAFSSQRDGNYEIYVMNVDGGGQTRLTMNPAFDGYPFFSPDGTKIVFVSNRDDNEEIYVMNSDGASPVRLTNNPAQDGEPRWSPDGRRIAFSSNRDGDWEIYVMNSDGSAVIQLTFNTVLDNNPCWSPDGRKIAFSSLRDGNYEIHVMNADGSDVTLITNDPAQDWLPDWSPFLRK